MSDIYGKGYGDKHDWKRGYTPQVGSWDTKSTSYRCGVCGEKFTHFYDAIPDIFQAMQHQNVNAECKPPTEPKNKLGLDK